MTEFCRLCHLSRLSRLLFGTNYYFLTSVKGRWTRMKKIWIIMLALVAVAAAGVILVLQNSQHFLARQANQMIEAGGIKLMMPETEAKELLGEPESFLQGFGGYRLEYSGKGLAFTFLDDMDTDFYKKVDQIEISVPGYSVYGISAGDDYKSSLDKIFKKGFGPKEGYTNFWKQNLFITIEASGDKVQRVTIGILDKTAASRVY